MNQTALYTLIGNLVNDPNHDRYSTSQIDQVLDNVQNRWNIEAGILRQTDSGITIVAGTRQYNIDTLSKTVIDFRRATFRGVPLEKRSKNWMDLYTGNDWTLANGTPTIYLVELDTSFSGGATLTLYPNPQSGDAGLGNFVVEYIYAHTPMANLTDSPFNGVGLLAPYHYGVAYEAAANLLTQDPDPNNQVKMDRYQRMSNNVMAEVVQVYKSMEKEEPWRLAGGRYWR